MEVVSVAEPKPIDQSSSVPNAIRFHEAEDPIQGGDEACRLLYTNHEVEVKRYREIPTRAMRNFRVTKVISPYLFHTEFDYPTPVRGYRDWRWAMQDFYNDPEKSEYYTVDSSILLKYRCYAYLDPGTKLWERVRVMKYDVKEEIAEIYMFEYNEFRIVPKSSLMELCPDFSTWAAQGFPTHLLNIQPVNGSAYWPKDAVDHFRKLVEGKSFATVVISRTDVDFPEGFPDNVEYLGVVMIQRDPQGSRTLQAEMVRAGFAEATGCFGGYVEMLIAGGGSIGRFDLNHYDIEPPKSFMVPGYSYNTQPCANIVRAQFTKIMANAEFKRCTEYGEPPGPKAAAVAMPPKPPKALAHQLPLDFTPDMFAKHSFAGDTEYLCLPDLFKAAVCQIRFSHMSCPSILYVQLENYINELREMETAITLLVQDEEPVPFDKAVPGLPIACLIQADRTREPTWVRAVVRHPLPGVALLKVILVDYGTEVSIKPPTSRYLPSYFQRIPGFSHRVHLDSTMLVPTAGRMWSSSASDTFRKYMSAWNQQVPVYCVWSPPTASLVKLDEYNQDLQWNPVSHKWEANPSKISPLNSQINAMASHPLIVNLFRSVGVDVVYELMTKDDTSDYEFEALGDVVVECGFAMRLLPMKSLWGQHSSIIHAAMDTEYVKMQKAISAGEAEVPEEEEEDALPQIQQLLLGPDP